MLALTCVRGKWSLWIWVCVLPPSVATLLPPGESAPTFLACVLLDWQLNWYSDLWTADTLRVFDLFYLSAFHKGCTNTPTKPQQCQFSSTLTKTELRKGMVGGGNFSPLEWQVSDKQSKKLEWTTQYWMRSTYKDELMFSLIQTRIQIEKQYQYTGTSVVVHIHNISWHCSLRGPRSNTTQEQQAHLGPRSWFLISFSRKRNQGFLEKWLILGLGHWIYKLSKDHLNSARKWVCSKKQVTGGHVGGSLG